MTKIKKTTNKKKRKLIYWEITVFVFMQIFKIHKKIEFLKTTKGLDYFLNGFKKSQIEIENFIKRCKKSENNDGYITYKFFDIKLFSDYKFHEGPFAKTFLESLK